MATVSSPGIDFLSPQELQGVLGDLHQGVSFVDAFLPPTPSPTGNGVILKTTKTGRFGLPQESTRIRPGDTAKRGQAATFTNVAYECEEYVWEVPTPWTSMKRAQDYLNTYAFNAQIARDIVVTDRDVNVATTIADASWVFDAAPAGGAGGQWNASTGDPIRDLLLMRQSIRPARATDVLMAQDVWASFIRNATVLASMNTSQHHALADEDFFANEVAKKLGFRKLVIVDSMYNSSQAAASETLAEIFAGKCFVGQVESRPGLASSSGQISGMTASALVRVVEEPLSLLEYDEESARSRIAQAHLSEITVVADTRLGALLHTING